MRDVWNRLKPKGGDRRQGEERRRTRVAERVGLFVCWVVFLIRAYLVNGASAPKWQGEDLTFVVTILILSRKQQQDEQSRNSLEVT